MADLGTDAFEQESTLRMMENEEETLGRIEASLERIEDGTYGDCEECGRKVPKARLNAIPYAALCVKCASELERR
jgi:DnaK suppressor protein